MSNIYTQKMASVSKSLTSAVKAESSVMAKCVEAAQLATKQLNPKLAMDKAIDAVVKLYADDFGAGNVRRNFKDALTIAACADKAITFEVPSKGEKKVVTEKPEDVLKRGKHAINSAAATLRGTKGTKTPAKTASKAKPDAIAGGLNPTPQVQAKVSEAKRDEFYKLVTKCLENEKSLALLKDALKSGGYRLAKIPKSHKDH